MRRQTIKQVLRKKLTSWMDTIEDTAVQGMVRQNAIVTGGAIPSLLMGEKPNDYDVYFKDLETAYRVAKYYVGRMPNNENTEVKIEDGRVWVKVRSSGVLKDDENDLEVAESIYTEVKKKEKFRPLCITDNAITLSDKVQLVIRFYGSPEEIHKNYDYIHATCVYDYWNETLDLPAAALESILGKNLVYCGSLYPVASVFRMRKFIKRGWHITAGQILKPLMQISQLDLSDPEVLREQLIGVDMAYMEQLILAVQKAVGDGERIDDLYLAKLIDEIFDEDLGGAE